MKKAIYFGLSLLVIVAVGAVGFFCLQPQLVNKFHRIFNTRNSNHPPQPSKNRRTKMVRRLCFFALLLLIAPLMRCARLTPAESVCFFSSFIL